MNVCHGCLKDETIGFCSACETKLFERSKVPPQLDFDWIDIQDKINGQPAAFSISGVQPKGFVGRNKNKLLAPNKEIESMYIIKPSLDSRRNLFNDSPANEHLTMTMARQLFKISAADCAYMRFANGEPAYITKRFDRNKMGLPLSQEDFVSVLNAIPRNNDHGMYKYNSFTYEDVGRYLNPIDQINFVRILIFNFLSGNGDVHLKCAHGRGVLLLVPGRAARGLVSSGRDGPSAHRPRPRDLCERRASVARLLDRGVGTLRSAGARGAELCAGRRTSHPELDAVAEGDARAHRRGRLPREAGGDR